MGEGESGLLCTMQCFLLLIATLIISMTETAKPATGPEGRHSTGPMHFTEVGLGAGRAKGPRSCYCED